MRGPMGGKRVTNKGGRMKLHHGAFKAKITESVVLSLFTSRKNGRKKKSRKK